MRLRLRQLRHWLARVLGYRSAAETSRLIVGSTGSGKSEGELVDLVRLANRAEHAVILLDGHGPLALRTAGHWAARGHAERIVYEPLDATDRVLCWHMLPRSDAADPSRRRIEDAETREEVAQCFLAQRNLLTLADKPWTKEWLDAAIALCLAQPAPEPLGSLLAAFQVGTADYERLLRDADQPAIVAKFRGMERLKRRYEVQYEIQTGASRRLLELICESEIVRLRSRPGPFDWLQALKEKQLIAFDGGGIRAREIKRTLFLLVTMQVIHAVRRQFAETQAPLPVVLVLEEAGALGLVTPFVLTALQELRKAGLSIHIITQSSVDFGDAALFQAILASTPWQAWYQVLAPADQELAAKVLTNATFDPLAVHFTRERAMASGIENVRLMSRGETLDPLGHTILRRDQRTATALRTTYRHLTDPYYKAPYLVEQEFRTSLATLRIGERFVRDRVGIHRERVTLVRSPWLCTISDTSTRVLIERLRHNVLYQPCQPPDVAAPGTPMPDAAARLRSQGHH